jgi:hypothetical protein
MGHYTMYLVPCNERSLSVGVSPETFLLLLLLEIPLYVVSRPCNESKNTRDEVESYVETKRTTSYSATNENSFSACVKERERALVKSNEKHFKWPTGA